MARKIIFPFTFLLLLYFPVLICAQSRTVGVFEYTPQTQDGYTLFAPFGSDSTYLIDNCGHRINVWPGSSPPGFAVYLLENGDLLRAGDIGHPTFGAGGAGGRIELWEWDGQLRWRYDFSSPNELQHHDLEPLPNGNILVLAWDLMSGAEAAAAGRDPMVSSGDIWSEKIVEIKPLGTDSLEVVWEWKLRDHLIQDYDPGKPDYGDPKDFPGRMDLNFVGLSSVDWIHFNDIDYNADLDQILITSRHTNEFYVIDHSTTTQEAAGESGGLRGKGGEFLYRWGNPLAYGRGTAADQVLFRPHDARWIPTGFPWEHKIMVLNNGTGRPSGDFSSVDVIEPAVDANGNYAVPATQAFGPQALFWSYSAPNPADFYGEYVCGALPQPNGNVLVTNGPWGTIFEVDSAKNEHWRYVSPVVSNGNLMSQGDPQVQVGNGYLNGFFRAEKYAPDYAAFAGRQFTPGGPVELNPWPDSCDIFTGLPEAGEVISARIWPNPVRDRLFVEALPGNQIRVLDLRGQVLWRGELPQSGQVEIPFWGISRGLYLVEIVVANGARKVFRVVRE